MNTPSAQPSARATGSSAAQGTSGTRSPLTVGDFASRVQALRDERRARLDALAGSQPRKAARYKTPLISSVPALLALGAVVLYTVGLVTRIGELHAASLDAADSLALTALEDHLVTGISSLATTAAVTGVLWIVGLTVAVSQIPVAGLWARHRTDVVEIVAKLQIRYIALGFYGVALAVAAAFAAGTSVFAEGIFYLVLAAAGVASVVFVFTFKGGALTQQGWKTWAVCFLLAWGVAQGTRTLFFSRGLEQVTLTVTGGGTVGARLVAVADGTWYVVKGREGPGEYRAYPADEITSARLWRDDTAASYSGTLADRIGLPHAGPVATSGWRAGLSAAAIVFAGVFLALVARFGWSASARLRRRVVESLKRPPAESPSAGGPGATES
jgi:hypothetical protein